MSTTQRAVIGTATDQKGQAAINTVKAYNSFTEENKLRFKLAAAGDSTATDIVLFPGAGRAVSLLALQNKLTFTCSTGFSSFAEMMSYFHKGVTTKLKGLIIQTTDTDNYEDNFIIIEEQSPTGKKVSTQIELSDFRTSSGNTWSDKIVLEGDEFDYVLWEAFEMRLNWLKPGSSMTFTFLMEGWNKVQELSGVKTTTSF